jgi:hypothetical protein
MTPPGSRYRTPEAARRAVTDQLRTEAASGPWPLADMQRQYAYDRAPGYRAEARRTVGLSEVTLEDALDTVRPFLNPVLDTSAAGVWEPERRAWRPVD